MAIKNYSVNITKDTEDVDYKPTDIKQSFKDLDINKLDLANLENKDNLDPTEIIHPINILIEKNKPNVDINVGRSKHNVDTNVGRSKHNVDINVRKNEPSVDINVRKNEPSVDINVRKNEPSVDINVRKNEPSVDINVRKNEPSVDINVRKNEPSVDIYTESPIEIIEPNTHEFNIYQSSHNIPTTLIDTHHHTTDDEDIPTHKIKYEESEEIKVIPKIKTDSERRDDIIYEFVKLKAKYGKTDHIEIPKFTENLSEIESRYKNISREIYIRYAADTYEDYLNIICIVIEYVCTKWFKLSNIAGFAAYRAREKMTYHSYLIDICEKHRTIWINFPPEVKLAGILFINIIIYSVINSKITHDEPDTKIELSSAYSMSSIDYDSNGSNHRHRKKRDKMNGPKEYI